MKKPLKALAVLTCGAALLFGAGALADSDHPVITMNAPYRNMSAFMDLLHEKYPEINLEIAAYNGQNTTAWMMAMRNAGELPDIYFTTYYTPGRRDDEGDFLNLAGYALTDKYVQSRLREVTLNGGIYMLPLGYNALGITYNKTLLDANGWSLPTSLKEMEELKAVAEAAGYTLCRDQLQYPGYGFQYLCNIVDTDFLSTVDGQIWQNDFLNGDASVSDTPEMVEAIHLLDRWRDLGLLNADGTPDDDTETKLNMVKGNTLFLIGNSNDIGTETGAQEEYRLMPYLSEDGDQNVFILNVSRYMGLNKELGEAGNEQKLEDALHVLELISTVEGMQALDPTQSKSRLLPLKEAKVSEDSYYATVLDELNAGSMASFIYNGWENIVVVVGEKMIDYVKGNCTVDDVIACMDENQHLITEADVPSYTTVTETLDTATCAKLVGICFAQATDSDMALISYNEYKHYLDSQYSNRYGVNGSLFALPVTDQEITSIIPNGWNGNIDTVTLTGARIRELAEKGYDFYGNGDTFPYLLVTKEGTLLDDNTTYCVAVCGVTDAVKEEGNIQDSGVKGLDAMREYFSRFETFSAKDIIWE